MLFFAVKGGKEDCVTILLENHADINAIGAVSIRNLLYINQFKLF